MMNKPDQLQPDQLLDAQADLLAEAALNELGDVLLDEPDEYAEQCDYAGCYPWLAEVIHAHPHDSKQFNPAHGTEGSEDDISFTC